jgi:hypothetical protein
MSRSPALVSRAFSGAFGALMVAAAAGPSGRWGLAVLALAAVAVVAGLFVRPVATAAVLLTVAAVGLSDPAPLLVVVSGLSASAYLLSRYADEALTFTSPTVAGMLGFAAAGAAATAVSVRMSWVPLVAPAIVATILMVVAAPLLADVISGPAADREPPG